MLLVEFLVANFLAPIFPPQGGRVKDHSIIWGALRPFRKGQF